MQPLDLRHAPPREPRAALAGVVFLPRTIDKIRAGLPGGFLGDYTLEGLTAMMLEQLQVSLERITGEVTTAASDDDVAAFVTATVHPDAIAAWNAFVVSRKPGGGDPAVALQRYPWLGERPDLTVALDVLAEDDRRSF